MYCIILNYVLLNMCSLCMTEYLSYEICKYNVDHRLQLDGMWTSELTTWKTEKLVCTEVKILASRCTTFLNTTAFYHAALLPTALANFVGFARVNTLT